MFQFFLLYADMGSWAFQPGVNYGSNNIDWKDVPSVEDCASWCIELNKCKGWTWDITSTTCYRKSKITQILSNSGTISGISGKTGIAGTQFPY